MVVAFSTSSSNATIPTSLKAMQENFGVSKSISSFTIPLGSTINMDGTAIMQGMVLTEIGLPLDGIALIMGIDRLLDMLRTVVNVTGDAICTLIVAKTESEIVEVKKKSIVH